MRTERPTEYKAIRAFGVAVALAVPVAKRELANWKPLENPREGLDALKPWRELATGEREEAVHLLSEGALMPRLRHALIDWSPRNFEPCIRLVEACHKALPSEVVDAVISQVVLPRLEHEVQEWNPRADKTSIHLWIHPWLPVLGKKLDSLWVPIRFKLSSCLERWDPSDHSAKGMLQPWRKVFDPSNWDPLVEKVCVRLERSIQATEVNPNGQDVRPIEDLKVWLGTLPLARLENVLEASFFPLWHEALRKWLRVPECDYTEVLEWYRQWRTLLEDPALCQDQGKVALELGYGLEVLHHFMSGDALFGGVSDEGDAGAMPE